MSKIFLKLILDSTFQELGKGNTKFFLVCFFFLGFGFLISKVWGVVLQYLWSHLAPLTRLGSFRETWWYRNKSSKEKTKYNNITWFQPCYRCPKSLLYTFSVYVFLVILPNFLYSKCNLRFPRVLSGKKFT